jgi:hypothetical protein
VESNERLRDETVSAGYREIAREAAPDALDREILTRSVKATKPDKGRWWREMWYRPAIFVGLFGLTLSLLLELTTPDAVDMPTGTSDGAFDAAVSEAEALASDAESLAEATMRDAPGAAPDPSAMEAPAPRDTLIGNKAHCKEEERATASLWWECIEELERQGRHDAAELELQALLGTYPEFNAPKRDENQPQP